jgi:hypothetical protein
MSTKRTQSNNTQAVISLEQQFILAKKNNESTEIICPFYKFEERYHSKFFLSLNQLHRVQTLYEILSDIAKYTVSDNIISFDCISKLPDDMFGGSNLGYIHYSSVVEKRKGQETEITVEPKLVFETQETNANIKTHSIFYDQKVKFKADFLKAFPVILKQGFIFTTVDKQTCQLYMSIMNPSQNFIGDCTKFEVNSLIQYLLPLWSIFDINIGKNIKIFMRNDFLGDLFKDHKEPILFHAKYELDKPSNITVMQMGEYIEISQ